MSIAYTLPTEGQPGEWIGVVPARDLKQQQMSLKELKWRKQKLRQQGQQVNNYSILNERLDLYESIEQKRKSKRKRRKTAQQQHQQQTNKSTVVELFPQNATVDDQLISSFVSQSNPEQTQPVVEPLDDSSSKHIPPKKIVAYDWNQLMEENW